MKPLTLDDLIPLEEFVAKRQELFESQCRYIDRYRRAQIGPRVTLVFENRQTLWFRVQDILRVARLSDPELIQHELNIYNRLLPDQNCLQAALLIGVEDKANLLAELRPWQELEGQHLRLCLGESSPTGDADHDAPEDRCMGTSHWVRFPLDVEGRQLLETFQLDARFEITLSSYAHRSVALGRDIRQSLLDDLAG